MFARVMLCLVKVSVKEKEKKMISEFEFSKIIACALTLFLLYMEALSVLDLFPGIGEDFPEEHFFSAGLSANQKNLFKPVKISGVLN